MEPLCAAVMVVLALCGPGDVPSQAGAPAQLLVMQYSPSNDLLGRRMAVAPAAAPGPRSRGPVSAAAPWGDPRRMAFCGPDGIQRTVDGGQTWSNVPTDGVVALAAGTELPLAARLGPSPTCQSVTLDPRGPDTFYAVFQAVKAPQDAPPPWFAVGYVTRDAGQSWQPAPAPSADTDARFGGFVSDETGVSALYGRRVVGAADADPAPATVRTVDAGESWQQVPFGCAASGSCIRWGAPPSEVTTCNMRAFGQPLLVSENGGQHWGPPAGAKVVNACRPNELVTISQRDVLLLAPGGDELEQGGAPVRVSHDGGRTFAPQPLPEGPALSELFELYLLPDDRLLARVSGQQPGAGWSWQILWHDSSPPAQDRWCGAAEAPLPTSGAPLRVAGNRVWWITPEGQPASLALADLRCAGQG